MNSIIRQVMNSCFRVVTSPCKPIDIHCRYPLKCLTVEFSFRCLASNHVPPRSCRRILDKMSAAWLKSENHPLQFAQENSSRTRHVVVKCLYRHTVDDIVYYRFPLKSCKRIGTVTGINLHSDNNRFIRQTVIGISCRTDPRVGASTIACIISNFRSSNCRSG